MEITHWRKFLTGKQLKLVIIARIIYTKSLATTIKIQSKNHVLIDKVWINHHATEGLEKKVLLVVNVILRM